MTTERRLRAIVTGRVQGVGYRFFTQRIAVSKHLIGYVKNQWDRTVLVEAQGEKSELESFLQVLQQGTGYASVENIQVEWVECQSDCIGFEIKF